jgi:hypothetical protein
MRRLAQSKSQKSQADVVRFDHIVSIRIIGNTSNEVRYLRGPDRRMARNPYTTNSLQIIQMCV